MDKYDYIFLLIMICIYAYRHWRLRDDVEELWDIVEELQEKLEEKEGETRE